jgi:hypothetical protein
VHELSTVRENSALTLSGLPLLRSVTVHQLSFLFRIQYHHSSCVQRVCTFLCECVCWSRRRLLGVCVSASGAGKCGWNMSTRPHLSLRWDSCKSSLTRSFRWERRECSDRQYARVSAVSGRCAAPERQLEGVLVYNDPTTSQSASEIRTSRQLDRQPVIYCKNTIKSHLISILRLHCLHFDIR